MEEALINVLPDLETLSREAAHFFVKLSSASVQGKGIFSVALAGGSTPRTLYQLLASSDFKERIPWPGVHLFWGDERCVPPSHRDSNYKMVQETLISRITIPPENIHRMPGELDPGQGAGLYEKKLRDFFEAENIPRFDLILLGLGTDGHIASLFPGSPALQEKRRLVVPASTEGARHHRLTLTLPVINNARRIFFMVAGAEKAGVLAHVLQDQEGSPDLPARMVSLAKGELSWYLDQAAVGLLK